MQNLHAILENCKKTELSLDFRMSLKAVIKIPNVWKQEVTLASCNPGCRFLNILSSGDTACSEHLQVDLKLKRR